MGIKTAIAKKGRVILSGGEPEPGSIYPKFLVPMRVSAVPEGILPPLFPKFWSTLKGCVCMTAFASCLTSWNHVFCRNCEVSPKVFHPLKSNSMQLK